LLTDRQQTDKQTRANAFASSFVGGNYVNCTTLHESY